MGVVSLRNAENCYLMQLSTWVKKYSNGILTLHFPLTVCYGNTEQYRLFLNMMA